MRHWLKYCALSYAAGTVGGLAMGGLVWACGQSALTAAFGGQLASALPHGLYARLVWAGLCGLLFVVPWARSSLLLRGLVWALVVSALQLVILPLWHHSGPHILALSTLSLLVLNCVWGLVTSAVLRLIQ